MRLKIGSGWGCVIFLLLLGGLCGCGEREGKKIPARLQRTSSSLFYGPAGSVHTVKVEVASAPVPGLLGGKGESVPLEGIAVGAERVDTPEEAFGIRPIQPVSGPGGEVSYEVRLGKRPGDGYLSLFCRDKRDVRQTFRFVSGVSLRNTRQEVLAGGRTEKALEVILTDGESRPVSGIPVYFSLPTQPGKGGTLSVERGVTDQEGIARTFLRTVPGATGVYKVRADIASSERGWSLRPLSLDVLAISPLSLLVAVFGGLAIFIFGMTLMSDGLQQVAGSRMKSVLNYMTRNRVMAVLAGTAVTALIQSSSATTVMTVGFVNAGLLSLKQAIGVVFGANIGTTITGQMVSFNLSGLALPATIAGVCILLLSKRAVLQGIARTTLGFGLLFFGMNLMSDRLSSVSSFPSFVHFFSLFDCTPLPGEMMPIGAVLGAVAIGMLTTMTVQSSSATIGLAIALANSGLLSIWTAIPIVLGDNIGTTITAVLASIGTQVSAKRTALAHAMFNLLGTGVMILLFYVRIDSVPVFIVAVDLLTAGDGLNGENLGRHVATAHTLFNLSNVLIMTPFIGGLAWICERLVKDPRRGGRNVKLEPHLLNAPSLALECATRALSEMTQKAWRAAHVTLGGYRRGRPVSIDRISGAEEEVDRMQAETMEYLVQLTRKKLSEKQAQTIPLLMHCVNDAERISDLAFLVARTISSLANGKNALFTPEATGEVAQILKRVERIASATLGSLKRPVPGAVSLVHGEVEVMKELVADSVRRHGERIQSSQCTPQNGVVFIEVVSALEGIVRHLENIVERSGRLF